MYQILQNEKPGDSVIVTGKSHKLLDFVHAILEELYLDYRSYAQLIRPSDIMISKSNIGKVKNRLKGQATKHFNEIVSLIIKYETKGLYEAINRHNGC